MFLKSSASAVKSILGFGRGVRISTKEPRVPRAPRRSGLSGRVLRGMSLFDFAMHGMTAKGWIILFQLELLGLEFLVAGGGITRRRLALLAGLGALDGNDLPRHKSFFLFWLFFGLFLFGFHFGHAYGINGAEHSEAALP